MSTADDHVWISPARMVGQPCVGGSRIPTATIANYVWSCGMDNALVAYPLSRGAALVACWYEATGRQNWRRRWGQWARDHGAQFWHCDYDHIDDPPTEGAHEREAAEQERKREDVGL